MMIANPYIYKQTKLPDNEWNILSDPQPHCCGWRSAWCRILARLRPVLAMRLRFPHGFWGFKCLELAP